MIILEKRPSHVAEQKAIMLYGKSQVIVLPNKEIQNGNK